MRGSLVVLALALCACGPGGRVSDNDGGGGDDTGPCQPGATKDCYDGVDGTEGVGACHKGKSVCQADGTYGVCANEVVPVAENCTDGIDNNCNGMVDEDIDEDGDGFTSCSGHDCCDSTTVCTAPALVNPGAFDAPGNGVDDDCDGIVDNTTPMCDDNLASDDADPMDYAKAIDLCRTTTAADNRWGVISATFTLADGTQVPPGYQHSIRPIWGDSTPPQLGTSMMEIATGPAASILDTNPGFPDGTDMQSWSALNNGGTVTTSGFPADFFAANGGVLPNAPNCVPAESDDAHDSVMLTLQIRVPTNALSFSLNSNFFSAEFPEWVCSPFNDFFVILLDSTYSGSAPNPTDKNLAFYQPPMTTDRYPVGVNLAEGDHGLFTQCINGVVGCSGVPSQITTCIGTDELSGTGLDTPSGGCEGDDLEGGGTGWLTTTGNVKGGEIITLRIAIWNTSDDNLQTLALIDAFKWSVLSSDPGTVIGRTR